MTLGWRPALTDEVSAPFMQTGTMHIFAISGLHIALIAGILVAILRAAQLPRFWCGVGSSSRSSGFTPEPQVGNPPPSARPS